MADQFDLSRNRRVFLNRYTCIITNPKIVKPVIVCTRKVSIPKNPVNMLITVTNCVITASRRARAKDSFRVLDRA